MDADLKRSAFARLPETIAIIDRARTLAIGEVLPTSELNKLTGRSDVLSLRGLCASAAKALEDEGIFLRFGPKTLGGLKRMAAKEVCDRSESRVYSVRRATKREIRRLAHVDMSQLDPEGVKQHLVVSSQLGILNMMSGTTATKKIAGHTNGTKLQLGETLSLFTTAKE